MKPIWLDVDTGVDDALAIMLAVRSQAVHILGISTVSGNCHVTDATRNTCAILDLLEDNTIPVAKGMEQPLLRPWVHAADVHGDGGLGNLQLSVQRERVVDQHAVPYMIEQIMRATEPITFVTLGPLTNVAAALQQEPRLREKIDEIIIMGGASSKGGNVTPVAEFNVYVDPDAAKIVLQSGLPIQLVTWDVTLDAWLSEDEVQQLEQSHDPVANGAGEAIRFLQAVFGSHVPLCDPTAVAALLQPSLIESNTYPVEVETMGELTRGMTVIDRRAVVSTPLADDQRPRIAVAEELDRKGFAHLFLEIILQK